MGYKEWRKYKELQDELQGEEEDMLRSMTPEERRKYLRESAKLEAKLYADNNPFPKEKWKD